MHENFLTNLSLEQPSGVHESDMDRLLTNTMSLLFTGVTSAHVILCMSTCSVSAIYLACAVYVYASISVVILRLLNVRSNPLPQKSPHLALPPDASPNRRSVMHDQGCTHVCFSASRQLSVSSAAEH